jgi:alkylation response protein AidB-like acyl-CoA dehydrogenase
MFIPGIERMGTDEQKAKWLPLAQTYQLVGTYAQTELGHGKLSIRDSITGKNQRINGKLVQFV